MQVDGRGKAAPPWLRFCKPLYACRHNFFCGDDYAAPNPRPIPSLIGRGDELRRESGPTFRKAVLKSLFVPTRNRPGFVPGGAESTTAAGHEATGGSDAVRVSADAENATAIGQSTRTASGIQPLIGRRESRVVVLTQPSEHRSCHPLQSKIYIDLALCCIKYCTVIVLCDGTLHVHGALQNRALTGTIAGIPALPAHTTIRPEDRRRASRADARGRGLAPFLAASRCASSTVAGGLEQIGGPSRRAGLRGIRSG